MSVKTVAAKTDDPVIIMRTRDFRGSEIDARDILLGEIIKMYPRSPLDHDLALAHLQRAVRRRIPDVRLSVTTYDALTKMPLHNAEACFLIRPAPRPERAGTFA